jgi:hypothetical protein
MSALGRWISADAIVPEPGNPQSLNRYSWVLGNPLKFVDPTGQKEEEACSLSDEECIDDETFWYVETCLENPDDPGCQPTATPAEAAFWFVVMVGGAELVIGAVEVAGSYIWGVLTAASADGDPTNEAKQTIEWLEGQAGKVEHIMQSRHAWEGIVQLSGDAIADYRAVQPYIQQAVNLGQAEEIAVSRIGRVIQYTLEVHGQQIIVRGVQLANNVFRIADAWVRK